MKVLYVSPWAHRVMHASPAALRETRQLKDAGVDVTLLTCCGLIDGAGRPEVPHWTVFGDGGPFRRAARALYRLRALKWALGFVELAATMLYALAACRRRGFDAFHLRDGEPLVFLPFLLAALWPRRVRGVVVLVSSENHIAPGSGAPLSYETLVPALNNLPLWAPVLRRAVARHRLAVVCPDRFSAEGYRSYLDGVLAPGLRTIPFGVDLPRAPLPRADARARLGLTDARGVFLLFGYLHPGKDPESVAEALGRGVPGLRVLVVGLPAHGEGSARLRALIRGRGLQDAFVIVERYVPEEEKARYFSACDAVLLPYKAGFRQSASSLWEACRFRRPVLASRIPPLDDVERYGLGLSCEPEDPGSLRAAMLAFLASDERTRARMEDGCERFCRDHSASRWAAEHAAIYAELAGGGK